MTSNEQFEAKSLEEMGEFSGERLAVTASEEERLYQTGGKTPAEVIKLLESRGVKQVAICGGARVYREFLVAGLVDEMYVTIEPVFLGEGIKLFGEFRRCLSSADPHRTCQYGSGSPNSVATGIHPNTLILEDSREKKKSEGKNGEGIKLFGEFRRCLSSADPHRTCQYGSGSPNSVAEQTGEGRADLFPYRLTVKERIVLSAQTEVWHLG
jgi:hypothetical protein